MQVSDEYRPWLIAGQSSLSGNRFDVMLFSAGGDLMWYNGALGRIVLVMAPDRDATIYMLARRLFDLGAISFGDFTLGRTAVHSPVYVNPRRILSEPVLLQQVAQLLDDEIKAAQGRR